jgi:hypothetical protein
MKAGGADIHVPSFGLELLKAIIEKCINIRNAHAKAISITQTTQICFLLF